MQHEAFLEVIHLKLATTLLCMAFFSPGEWRGKRKGLVLRRWLVFFLRGTILCCGSRRPFWKPPHASRCFQRSVLFDVRHLRINEWKAIWIVSNKIQQTYSRMISVIPLILILLFFLACFCRCQIDWECGLEQKTSAGMGNPHHPAQRLEFAAGDGNQEFAPRNEVPDLRTGIHGNNLGKGKP